MDKLFDYQGNNIFPETGEYVYPNAPWDSIVHRGWYSAPVENTLPAFYEAKINGYNWVECDVRLTYDNVWILSHDATITDKNGTTYTIVNETASTLTALVLDTDATYGDIHPPTLEQMLLKASILNLGVVIDIKVQGTETTLNNLAQTVLSTGRQGNVIYMPKDATAASYIAAIDNQASFDFAANYTAVSDLPSLTDYQNLLTESNTVCFDLQAIATDSDGGISTELISTIRAAGLNVSFWNIRQTAYTTYMNLRPLRITYQSGSEDKYLDNTYLMSQTLY